MHGFAGYRHQPPPRGHRRRHDGYLRLRKGMPGTVMEARTEGDERPFRKLRGPVGQPSIRVETCRIGIQMRIVMECVLAERDLGTGRM